MLLKSAMLYTLNRSKMNRQSAMGGRESSATIEKKFKISFIYDLCQDRGRFGKVNCQQQQQ